MFCSLLQPVPNRCCPSSSFHAALCAHRRHLGSDGPFPGLSGHGGGREFQGASSSALPASKYAVHLLEGKNNAALFNFWKKPDDSGRGQKYAYQPSPSHCLSCCFLRDRNMWLLKIPLQREYIPSPMGAYKLIRVLTYTTARGWEQQFQTWVLERGFLMQQKTQPCTFFPA